MGLPAMVEQLVSEEADAVGPIREIDVASLALPAVSEKQTVNTRGGRRLFDGLDLAELTVEELALRHYLTIGGFQCGIHCEGAILRDLFGLLLFNELFLAGVDGVFTSP